MSSFTFNHGNPSLSFLLLLVTVASSAATAWAVMHGMTPPATEKLTSLFPHLPIDKALTPIFGSPVVDRANNGSGATIALNKDSGSGLKSRDSYYYGFFSAAIKLPDTYSAGVVVAFYMTNSEVFPKNHDEIDFELLGHEKRKDWMLQTNIYGDGSVSTGREEKFRLWFDPTEDYHEYSILWNYHHILFLVDNVPVREVNHSEAMSKTYPSKPMSLYSTIWDGSEWATQGGHKPVNYKFAPFIASLKNLEISGCSSSQNKSSTTSCAGLQAVDGQAFIKLSQQQQTAMNWVRTKFMIYSYCNDLKRFKVTPPECR